MKVSLPGLLKNLDSVMDDSALTCGLRGTLDELLNNLRELKGRKAEGEKVIDEFFT